MRVAVLTSPPTTEERPDTADTFLQAREIEACLAELGHDTITVDYTPATGFADLEDFDPHVVFNLVEDIPEGPDQLHNVTMLLDEYDYPYTGAATEPLRILGNKLEMKARLRAAGLPVPGSLGDTGTANRWIVKSAREHASLGITSDNVVASAGAALLMIARRQSEFGGDWFAEEYIDGREFNVALLDGEILPIAEILFTDHDGIPKIVGYAEKWDTESDAYRSTPRIFPPHESPLFDKLARLASTAWELFALSGYARVDFRVDREGEPYILEVNANPCLASDAGFCAAAAERGLGQTDVVARILEATRA